MKNIIYSMFAALAFCAVTALPAAAMTLALTLLAALLLSGGLLSAAKCRGDLLQKSKCHYFKLLAVSH